MITSTIGTSDYLYVLSLDVYPLDIRWPVLFEDIKSKGVAFSKQSRLLGKEWSSFQRWMEGAQPRFGDGQAILILHSKICGIELTQKRLLESFSNE